MYYIYGVDKKFVVINKKNLRISLTKNLQKASVFTDTRTAKTWGYYISKRYPKIKLISAELKILEA